MYTKSRLSLALAALISVIVIVAVPFAREIQRSFGHLFHIRDPHIAGGIATGLVILYLIANVIQRRFTVPSALLRLALLGVLGVLTWALNPMSVEVVHIVTYATVGSLWYFATRSGWCALVLSNVVSLGDELFQAITPNRFFDVRDLEFNLIGALVGLILVYCNDRRAISL